MILPLAQCLLRCLAAAVVVGLLSACGAALTRNALPADQMNEAHPLGIAGLRAWGDVLEPHELDGFIERQADILRTRFGPMMARGQTPVLNYLAISGGGPDGAYGAGVLKAWSATGTRPEFQGVSGVSTGSMIAPFAFLGPEYDATLEQMYTTMRTSDLVSEHLFSGIVSGISLTDTAGLARKIAYYVTPEMLAKIAAEYRKGRLLFVGTTNLDAGRPMIWNMGAIAALGTPESLELFRQVIRASAAVPIAFPPVFIKVRTPDGREYDEMHVDGGATSQVVLISPQLPIAALTRQYLGRNIDRRLWVMVNNEVLVQDSPVEPRIGPVGERAAGSLIRGSGIGDVYKMYVIAQRDDMQFRNTWIPRNHPCTSNEMFDPVYMRCLFDFGGRQLREGTVWSDLPPYFVLPPPTPPRGTRRPVLPRPERD